MHNLRNDKKSPNIHPLTTKFVILVEIGGFGLEFGVNGIRK
jgi:hypothetical protein